MNSILALFCVSYIKYRHVIENKYNESNITIT